MIRFKQQDMNQFIVQFKQIKEMLKDYKRQVNTHIQKEFGQNLEGSILAKKHVDAIKKKEKDMYEWEASLHALKLEVSGRQDFLTKKQ